MKTGPSTRSTLRAYGWAPRQGMTHQYRHAGNPGHQITVAPDGSWVHHERKGDGLVRRAKGRTAMGLVGHLGQFHKDDESVPAELVKAVPVGLVKKSMFPGGPPLLGATSSGKVIHDPEHPVYRTGEKRAKWSSRPTPGTVGGYEGGKMLARRLPEYTRKDHEDAAAHHFKLAEHHQTAWNQVQHAAHVERFGKPPEFGDYRIAGVGRDEYSEAHKDALRHHATLGAMHAEAAATHQQAVKVRGLAKSDGGDDVVKSRDEEPHWRAVEAAGWKFSDDKNAYTHADHPGHGIYRMGGGKFYRHQADGKTVSSGSVVAGPLKGGAPGGLAGHIRKFHETSGGLEKAWGEHHVPLNDLSGHRSMAGSDDDLEKSHPLIYAVLARHGWVRGGDEMVSQGRGKRMRSVSVFHHPDRAADAVRVEKKGHGWERWSGSKLIGFGDGHESLTDHLTSDQRLGG